MGNAGKEGQDKITATWLKDRKRRSLRYGDIEHYQRTVAALAAGRWDEGGERLTR